MKNSKNSMYHKHVFYYWGGLVLVLAMLIPSTGYANTYYVSKTGNDSNPGTKVSSFQSIKHGVSQLSAGDTLYVKAGTYNESLLSWKTTIPNGTSWKNPVTVAVNPGDSVTITPPSGHAFFWVQDGGAKYLIIDGFVIDGKKRALHGFKFSNNSRYIRIQNSEIKNTTKSGILVGICAGCADKASRPHDTYHEFIKLNVHHCGTTEKDHGLYIETGYNLVEYSHVHHNSGNGGKFFNGIGSIQSSNYNIARYNTLHDNSQYSSAGFTFGWLLASGVGNQAYGNVAYNNNLGFAIGNSAIDALLYNNVSYDNRLYGINVYGEWGGSTGAKVFNNTVYGNGSFGIAIRNGAKNTVVRNNISYKNGPNASRNIWLEPNESPGTVTSHNYVEDPKFVDPASKDFSLQASSPTIDKGTNILEVATDFYGNARPQGSGFDIGAHEVVTGSDNSAPEKPKGVRVF